MSQKEVSNRVDQMLENGDYEGLEDMDSDEFARLMKELAADGSLEGLSQEEIAKRIEKLIQEGGE
jgi:DNA-binding Lrp family transcriptional regulator